MLRQLKGWIRSRPIRIAFLVQDGEHSSTILDGVFADCYSRWGGRFSLIVPCQDNKIPSAYWPWLETYDPDIVYSYVRLSDEDVLDVHERLSPAEYQFHEMGREPRLDVYGFKPHFHFSPLFSLSTIFRLARHSPRTEARAPIQIVDSWHTEQESRFLTDNFGTYLRCRSSGMYPSDATSAATLLHIVRPEIQADRRYGVPQNITAVPDEIAAFREVIDGRAITMSLCSLLFAPRLDVYGGVWGETFNLVVGDTFSDRILFWNARLLIPPWLDNELCCLRVTSEQLANPGFLALLGDMLKRRNHVTNGHGGQPQLAIRSLSLNAGAIEETRKAIASTKVWGMVMTPPLTSLEDVIPAANALRRARETSAFDRGIFQQSDWSSFDWTMPVVRPPTSIPRHLSDAPPRQTFTVGSWGMDMTLEHEGPRPRGANLNHLSLPRKWRMAGAFKLTMTDDVRTNEQIPPPRRNRSGDLSIFASVSRTVETVTVPTAQDAMRYAMALDGVRYGPARPGVSPHPGNKTGWLRPSNEARYLVGVLGLTGGLDRAEQLLLHPYLKDMFSRMGGTPDLSENQVTPTFNWLRKRFRQNPIIDVSQEHERQILARAIVKAAQGISRPREMVRHEDLKERWRVYREQFWARNPQQGAGDPSVDWDAMEAASLDGCLIEMRRRQMLYQGHQWTCRTCHHRNWVALEALSSELQCDVCKQAVDMPVQIPWLFRPNEFLIESLRMHSTLSLIWLLSALRQRSRHSFMYAGPTWFGYDQDAAKPDAEADLLVVLDGEAVLCEAKSSWRDLSTSDLLDFVTLAIRLNPDIALLAVMEEGAGPEGSLNEARARLEDVGIKFEILTTADYLVDDDGPYLHVHEEGR